MTRPIHVSLDLETWGTEPGCDIRSIGACVFDPVERLVAGYDTVPPLNTFYLACDNPIVSRDGRDSPRYEYPLTRDPRTVQWWSEQTDEARAAFADPVDLRECLLRLSDWMMHVCAINSDRSIANPFINPLTDIRIWSHGPAFDPPILAAAYKAVGLPVPWHYRAPRDTRTIFDLAGVDDHSAYLSARPGPLGIPHHALDDSICQARAVCDAWGTLQLHRDAYEAQNTMMDDGK